MNTVHEIRHAIRQLPAIERESLGIWLSGDLHANYSVREAALAYGDEPESQLLTADQYLEFELEAAIRHEFVAGRLYAMCGVSRSHQRIAGNLLAAFHGHLRGGPCAPYTSDFKFRLKSGRDDLFYYPDLMVACGQEGLTEYYLRQPKLVIEVLSPSTERIDLREKALAYRQVSTVEEYVMVAQDRPYIEFQRRSDDWHPTAVTSPEATATFNSIGLSLPLRQIYEDVPRALGAPLK